LQQFPVRGSRDQRISVGSVPGENSVIWESKRKAMWNTDLYHVELEIGT